MAFSIRPDWAISALTIGGIVLVAVVVVVIVVALEQI